MGTWSVLSACAQSRSSAGKSPRPEECDPLRESHREAGQLNSAASSHRKMSQHTPLAAMRNADAIADATDAAAFRPVAYASFAKPVWIVPFRFHFIGTQLSML